MVKHDNIGKGGKYWVEPKRLHDPMFWFMKASAYSSACIFIMEEFSEIRDGQEKPALYFNSIRAVPYLAGIASELYMKGYLIFKGEGPTALRNTRHNLKLLREKCVNFGDPRFKSGDLVFLTDTLGEHLMEDGGIRYPDKHEMPIYLTEFKKALDVLQKLGSEVSNTLLNSREEKVGI